MALYPHTIEGATYRRTSSGEEISESYIVSELTSTPAGRAYDAAITSGLPRWNQPHPSRPDLRVSDITTGIVQDQPNTMRVTFRYSTPNGGGGMLVDGAQVSMSTEILSDETIYDLAGNLLVTRYTRIIPAVGIEFGVQVHRVAVERPTFSLQIARVESSVGFSKATEFAGKTNSSPWQGRPEKTWLLRISSIPDDSGFRVTYDAVYNPLSWQATIIHQIDGITPETIRANNGQAVHDVYPTIDFNQLRLPRVI